MSTEKATFAAGCFWGVEETFRHVKGVHATAVAYTGGHTSDPTYEDICYRNTGHAEVVHLDFDPDEVSFEELLTVFWQAHDPTQLNRQGPDVGDQYRSAIFFHSAEQEAAAKASKGDLDGSGVHRSAIVTEITAAGPVHMAEDYHQQYVEKHNRGLFRQG